MAAGRGKSAWDGEVGGNGPVGEKIDAYQRVMALIGHGKGYMRI